MPQTLNEKELNLARLIIASQIVNYFWESQFNYTGMISWQNREPQVLRFRWSSPSD